MFRNSCMFLQFLDWKMQAWLINISAHDDDDDDDDDNNNNNNKD